MKKLYDDRVPILAQGTNELVEKHVIYDDRLNTFPVIQIFSSQLGWCVQFKDETGQLFTFVVDMQCRMWETLTHTAKEYDIRDNYIGGAVDIVFYITSNGWMAKFTKGKVNPYEELIMD